MSNLTPKVIFEDSHILVIDKPSGLIVNRSESASKQSTLQDWVASKFKDQRPKTKADRGRDFYKRAGIAHRLDKDTSGVMVIAKTESAFTDLQRQFKERKVDKEYIALVWGPIRERLTKSQPSVAKGRPFSNGVNDGLVDSFAVDAPIARNPKNRMKFAVVEGGRRAVTEFKVLRIFHDYSFLKCFPETGRTHQIRVHLTALNHPIVGDKLYSGRKRWRQSKKLADRMFLHASKLSFFHPKIKKRVSFESKLPKELGEVLKGLKHN